MAEADAPRTYRGNCHCGAFVYEVEIPEIKSVFECNCSVCAKKGYLYLFPGRKNFKVVKGSEDALTQYRFGSMELVHGFCPTCATPLLGTKDIGPEEFHLAINVHTIQGLNTWELERTPFDGLAMGEPYQVPVHAGEVPSVEAEGDKTYTGSCHCGALTVAVASKPLDETYEGAVECNCSICERIGAIWIYPMKERVVLSSADEASMGRYSFKRDVNFINKTFCKICGITMTNSFLDLSSEQLAAMGPEGSEAYSYHSKKHPVNARVLNGLDLSKLQRTKFDGWNKVPGTYANP
ncbi:Centromere protein V [Cladobotryum mycophilum]|uniref:Centromere protein V n=1 Tax=Cladobotryum mycophilum TaxID=491253 RepID=A0ABR0SU74_9HYPO